MMVLFTDCSNESPSPDAATTGTTIAKSTTCLLSRASAPIWSCRLASFNGATAEALVAALIGDSGNVVPSNILLDCPQVSSGLVSYGVDGHAFEALMIGTEVRRKRYP